MKSFYRIGEHLSLALVANHGVVLDTRTNRYAALPDGLAAELVTLSEHGPAVAIVRLLDRLARLGLSIERGTSDPISAIRTFAVAYPAHRAVAHGVAAVSSWRDTIDVFNAVVSSALRLRFGTFSRTLTGAAHSEADYPAPMASGEPGMLRCIATFDRIRSQVPIERSCLIDSLALRRFLRARHIACSLVIGVHMDPFAAHCWLQRDGLVLNEDPDMISRFSPIWIG